MAERSSSSFSTKDLCPGMGVVVHAQQPLLAHVSVDLRRLQAGMTQELLDRTQIGPPVEQMGGERVAKGVRMRGRGSAPAEDAADVPRTEPVPSPVHEHGLAGGRG